MGFIRLRIKDNYKLSDNNREKEELMVGTIDYITEKLNNDIWNLGDECGHGFEDYIADVIYKWCLNNQKAKVIQTEATNDNGKDIIILSEHSLRGLFGINFMKQEAKNLKIYVECKSSNAYKITYNDLSGNIKLSQKGDIDYYILVTNMTITPHTFYQLQQEAKERGFQFILIDQYALYRFLKENSTIIGSYTPPAQLPGIHAEYQVFSEQLEGKSQFSIYLFMRNYTDSVQKVDLHLKTDHNWCAKVDTLQMVLDPGASLCELILVDKRYYDGLDELCLMMQSTLFEKNIYVKGVNASFNFAPPLYGEGHNKVIDTLRDYIVASDHFNIFYLFGQAGIGKTRITEELSKKLLGTRIKCKFLLCSTKKNIFEKITKILEEEKLIKRSSGFKSLTDLFHGIEIKYKKYVIIIDDIHNADETFYKDIQELINHTLNVPVTLILLGRDDYTFGSTSYYSFVSWCRDENSPIKGHDIKPLSPIDSKNLIRSIINDVPELVLEKIHSLSNNIPLYIVQFIEYLLDIKLVQLINRSTVGILNVESFSSHLYIPDKLEDIYKRRINNLKDMEDGQKIIDFFYMASVIGIEFPKLLFLNYFHENEALLNTLLQRYLLAYTDNGELKFIHESFYLFIKKLLEKKRKRAKDIASKLIDNQKIFFDHLSAFDKGRIYYWNDQPEQSRAYFVPIIDSLRSIENYSSINLSLDYRSYLYDVYHVLVKLNEDTILLKNALFSQIYLTLHHFTPSLAVEECVAVERIVGKNATLKADDSFRLAVMEQKAHSYINMGQIKSGDSILQELLAYVLYNPDLMDLMTRFDMYDKLTNINLKYNNLSIAKCYNQLAFQTANAIGDKKLLTLADISLGKLLLYRDVDAAYEAILRAQTYLQEETALRINCHNNISIVVIRLREFIVNNQDLTPLEKEMEQLLKESVDHNYANSIIRSYLILAVISFYKRRDNYEVSLKYVECGINAGIQWGQGNYMWHFYNLKAIIAVHKKWSTDYVSKLFETVFRLLQKQNLLYLGSLDFTYENIPAITNVMKFLHKYKFENSFYQKMAAITYNTSSFSCDYNCENNSCNFSCSQTTDLYKEQYKKIGEGKLLLVDQEFSYPITDPLTGYYLIFA